MVIKFFNNFRIGSLKDRLVRLQESHDKLHQDIDSTEVGIQTSLEHLHAQLGDVVSVRQSALKIGGPRA